MIDLFFEGGWLFMSLISLLAIAMLFFAARAAARVYGPGADRRLPEPGQLYYIRYFGMLALVVGVLGQILGLYEAMKVISQGQEVSQAMLAAGIKVSSITTLYGFLVFLIAHLIWLVLDLRVRSVQALRM
jgi:hypothetical protein